MKKNNKNNSPVDDKSVDELVGELRNSFAKRDAVLFFILGKQMVTNIPYSR